MTPFAIYFPQYYPTITNDRAWGSGFTDWTLVANANLRNSWDRRAPERGFYDGSSRLVHQKQIVEARAAGLGGFGVYHYWFYSHQELSAFEETLIQRDDKSDGFSWFLIWASEGWSKRWIGDATQLVTLTAEPTTTDIQRHCDYLATCFQQPSYWKWEGKPLFVWYNLGHFINPERVVLSYKEQLSRRGFDVATAHFVKNPFDIQYSKLTDASYLFEPRLFFGSRTAARGNRSKKAMDFCQRLVGRGNVEKLLILIDRFQRTGTTYSAADFLSYMASAERLSLVSTSDRPVQEVISPGWNNTPRYGNRFTALECLTPEAFCKLVQRARNAGMLPPLINAWNEWSEGAAIEPCAYLGRSYLDAVTAGSAC